MNWISCDYCEEEFVAEVKGNKDPAYCVVCGEPLEDPNGEILDEDYLLLMDTSSLE